MNGIRRGRQRHRSARSVALAVALATVAAMVGGTGRALAAPAQAPPPTVSLGWEDGIWREEADCKGVERTTVEDALEFAIFRTGDTSTALEVPLSFAGSLAGAGGVSSPVTIPAGESSVVLTPEGATVGDDLTVDVQPSPDYVIGDPGRGTATMNPLAVDLVCGAGAEGNEQTVTLGSRPKPFDVELAGWFPPPHWPRSVDGDIPPGTEFSTDGTFSGVTTQVGTFRFQVYFCEDDSWCPYRANLTVHVVPTSVQPTPPTPPTAPPAAPVTTRPAYTG